MNSQEAQQAETIAVMKRRHKYQDSVLETKLSYESGIFRDCHSDREMLLEIVDSQVQTIAADKKAMEIAADLLGVKEHKISESAKVIAELEKDIVRLVSIIDDLQARAQTQADIGEKWLEATPEQVKDELQRGFHNGGDWEPDAIIRAHQLIGKQYTEQEIMEMCRIDPSICADGATCDGAIWFACMTGALKAEP